MEQVLNLMGPGSFTLGVLLTFYRVYLSQKDWNRIRDMPDDTSSELHTQISAMRQHLNAPIGHPGWQMVPILVGFGVMVACALLLHLVF